MIISKNTLYVTFLSLLNPIFGILYACFKSCNKYRYVVLSFLLSIFNFLRLPTGDIFRYYISYIGYEKSHDYTLLLLDIFLNKDYLFFVLNYVFSKMGFPFQFFIFCLSFLIWYTVFSLSDKLVQHRLRFSEVIITIALVWFLPRRRELSILFTTLAFYYFIVPKSKSSFRVFIFSFLAVSSHIFSFLPCLLLLIVSKIKCKRNRYFILPIFILCCSKLFFPILLNLLNYFSFIIPKITAYTQGYWAEEFMESYSFKMVLSRYLIEVIPFIIQYVVIVKSDISSERLKKVCFVMMCLVCIFFPLKNFYFRFSGMMSFVFVPYFINILNKRYCYVNRIVITSVLCLFFLIKIYSEKRMIQHSFIPRIIYSPTPLLFTNIYSKQYITNNISSDGDFK